MESPQKKRRIDAVEPTKSGHAYDPTSAHANAIDVLLRASTMERQEKAAIMNKVENNNADGGKKSKLSGQPAAQEATVYTPAITLSSSNKIEEVQVELSQASCSDAMLRNYEPVMHEVLGPESKLSQELYYEGNQSQVTDPAMFGAILSSQPYTDAKPPPLPQPILPHPNQSQSQLSLLPSQEFSQQFQMTQASQGLSQNFSMTLGSLPQLQLPDTNPLTNRIALPDTDPLTNRIAIPTPAVKSVTKNSILKAKNQTISKDTKKSTVEKNPRKSIEQQCAEEDDMKVMARRAVDLINSLAVNKKVEKQLLLCMTLTRQSPRTAGLDTLPPPGTKLSQGFQWAQFPPLEKYLKDHMEEYYELSIEKCQSVLQQEFNNKLVKKVIEMAQFYGWTFDFTHKGIRDRVRCYFKTHIQNAKKRLKTMCKNPTKRANAKALCAHLDLIEMQKETHEDIELANDFTNANDFRKDRGSTFSSSGILANIDDEDAAKVLAGGFK